MNLLISIITAAAALVSPALANAEPEALPNPVMEDAIQAWERMAKGNDIVEYAKTLSADLTAAVQKALKPSTVRDSPATYSVISTSD